MKKIMILIGVVVLAFSCETKQDWYDGGISSPYHDCSMMVYMRTDTYNYALTVQMIERGGLTDLFEGKVDTLPEITFLAPPSYSVYRYLLDHDMKEVNEMTKEACREMVLKHVIKGKCLKGSFAYRNPAYQIDSKEQNGGSKVPTLGECSLIIYRDKSIWGGVPDVGPEQMYIYSITGEIMVPLSSPDIQPLNGVVHALNYNYKLGDI